MTLKTAHEILPSFLLFCWSPNLIVLHTFTPPPLPSTPLPQRSSYTGGGSVCLAARCETVKRKTFPLSSHSCWSSLTCWSESIHLVLCLQIYCLSAHNLVECSVSLSAFLYAPVCLSASVSLSVCLCQSVCLPLSVCLSASVSLSLSVLYPPLFSTYLTYRTSLYTCKYTGKRAIGMKL